MTGRVFGEFELDEAARSLTLRGESVSLQPLVFDLLAYLLRHAGRVVPKAELMDALWPDLHVTEASLQRAVSLARTALKPGGLDGAIRNVVRLGYRFALDRAVLGRIEPTSSPESDGVAAARKAATERRWAEAAEHFAQVDQAVRLDPADLDLWAYALECLGRRTEAVTVYARAVEGHVAADDGGRAADSAVRLSALNLELGNPNVGSAWLSRAEELLGDAPTPSAAAFVIWMKSRYAIFAGRPDEALELAARASELAEGSASTGMRALTSAYYGLYDITLGRVSDGQIRQDKAAAIALSSETDPLTGSMIYCSILWTCRTFADWSRAEQWRPGFELWCKAAYAKITGACRLHSGEILGAVGRLSEGLFEIDESIWQLREEGTWEIGDAYRVRGDLRLMLGDLDAARRDYEEAIGIGWDAEPGLAQLLAASGDVRSALSSLDRSLAGGSWHHLQRRGWLLANKAQIAAVAGVENEAQAAIDELDASSEPMRIPAIRAMAVEAKASLAAGRGEESEALRLLYLARQLWTSVRHEYHAARLRLRLADLLEATGDLSGAQVERAAAISAAERIDAKGLLAGASRIAPTPEGRFGDAGREANL